MVYVPPSGALPASVRAVAKRAKTQVLEVVGDGRVMPAARLRGIPRTSVERVAGTIEELSLQPERYRDSEETMFFRIKRLDIATTRVFSEAAVAMTNTSRDVMLVWPTGRVRAPFDGMPSFEGPQRYVGAAAAFSAARKAQVETELGSERVPRLSLVGVDRYDTAARIAREAFPNGASRVYVVDERSPADVAVAVSAADGPVLPVPGCGVVPELVRAAARAMQPVEVVAVGGRQGLCEATVAQVAAEVTPLPQAKAVDLAVSLWDRDPCVLADSGEVRCQVEGRWVPLRGASGRVTTLGIVKPYADPLEVYGATDDHRLWVWTATLNELRHTTGFGDAVEVPPPAGAVERLTLAGHGRPCAVRTNGTVVCLQREEDGRFVWVTIPGLSRPVSLSTKNGLVLAVGADGRPRIWELTGTRALELTVKNLPATVVAIGPSTDSSAEVMTATADGTLRLHTVRGEFAGHVEVSPMKVPPSALEECVRRGELRCAGDGSVEGFVTPRGTRIVQVENGWIRLSDGRVFAPFYRDTVDRFAPIRGFGG